MSHFWLESSLWEFCHSEALVVITRRHCTPQNICVPTSHLNNSSAHYTILVLLSFPQHSEDTDSLLFPYQLWLSIIHEFIKYVNITI